MPIVGTLNSTDNFDVWIEMEISYLVSSCKSSSSFSAILIQVEMQKIQEGKVKILFLSKLIHRPFQLCTILNIGVNIRGVTTRLAYLQCLSLHWSCPNSSSERSVG